VANYDDHEEDSASFGEGAIVSTLHGLLARAPSGSGGSSSPDEHGGRGPHPLEGDLQLEDTALDEDFLRLFANGPSLLSAQPTSAVHRR
jgi:hypothetical protein